MYSLTINIIIFQPKKERKNAQKSQGKRSMESNTHGRLEWKLSYGNIERSRVGPIKQKNPPTARTFQMLLKIFFCLPIRRFLSNRKMCEKKKYIN